MKTINVPLNVEDISFNKEIYDKSGVFIIKNFINEIKIKELQNIWLNYYDKILKNGGRKVDTANFVNFKNELPSEMINFYKSKYVK